MRAIALVIVIASTLPACGTAAGTDWNYSRPGVTAAQRERDEQACRMSALGSADVNRVPTWPQTFNREAFNDCMRARGYDARLGQARP